MSKKCPDFCKDCHNFKDCTQKENMLAGTEPVEGFVFEGDVYCRDCLDAFDDVWDEIPVDGEWDCPQHCGNCGVPLEHRLTIEGVKYVKEALADGGGCCRELWPEVWKDYL